MKHLTKILCSVFLLYVLISCGKDDDENSIESTGYFNYKGTTYDVDRGELKYFGQEGDSYHFSTMVCSSGTWVLGGSEDGYINDNEGDYIEFDFYCSNGELQNGTYSYGTSKDAGTWNYAECGVNEGKSSYSYRTLKSGSLTIRKSGNTYTYSIDCVDEDGDVVDGEYTGELNYFDRSEE